MRKYGPPAERSSQKSQGDIQRMPPSGRSRAVTRTASKIIGQKSPVFNGGFTGEI